MRRTRISHINLGVSHMYHPIHDSFFPTQNHYQTQACYREQRLGCIVNSKGLVRIE
jgi:hypothetical protein